MGERWRKIPPLLGVRGVAKNFGAVVALRSADLEVRPGEVHALMGANGAGKSTLVKIITGVYGADAGELTRRTGAAARFRSPADARRAGVVSVYQDPAIVPDLTVAQNMRLARVSPRQGQSRDARTRAGARRPLHSPPRDASISPSCA